MNGNYSTETLINAGKQVTVPNNSCFIDHSNSRSSNLSHDSFNKQKLSGNLTEFIGRPSIKSLPLNQNFVKENSKLLRKNSHVRFLCYWQKPYSARFLGVVPKMKDFVGIATTKPVPCPMCNQLIGLFRESFSCSTFSQMAVRLLYALIIF
jgi:hypothetical protein